MALTVWIIQVVCADSLCKEKVADKCMTGKMY